MTRRMMSRGLSLAFFGLLWLLPPAVDAEPARWNVDPEHSTIEFRVAHMVVSKTTGHFTDYQGFIDMDAEAGTVKAIEATIKTASVTRIMRNAMLISGIPTSSTWRNIRQ